MDKQWEFSMEKTKIYSSYLSLYNEKFVLIVFLFSLVFFLFFSNPVHAEAENNYCPNPAPLLKNDPYECYNRRVYAFNRTLDTFILKPLAKTYKTIFPPPITKAVSNFFNNLDQPTTIANDFLQGKFRQMGEDTTRFLVNSTFGLGGIIDVASCGKIPQNYEDMGQTFASWGYKCSNYFVIPFLGPSTVRDTLGLPIDYFVLSAYGFIPAKVRYPMTGLRLIDRRSQLLELEDVANQAAVDRYVFERDAYLQRRAFLIAKNEGGQPDIYVGPENHEHTDVVLETTTEHIKTEPTKKNLESSEHVKK